VTSHKDANAFASHASCSKKAGHMYNACEWAITSRRETESAAAGWPRAIIAWAGILVRPDSPVYTAQQLADKSVGVPFYPARITSLCSAERLPAAREDQV